MISDPVIPHPWVNDRLLLEMVTDPLAAHTGTGAIVVEHHNRHGRSAIGVGEPAGVAHLLPKIDLAALDSVMVPRGTWELLPQAYRAGSALIGVEDWDWMGISHVPQVPGTDRVRELITGEDFAVLEQIRAAAIPHSFLTPERPGVRWFGWFDEASTLRAIGGAMGYEKGSWIDGAHFGSIGTQPSWQGRGIGAALTAGMVTLAFAEGAVNASLGVHAHNTRAIDLYTRLGFQTCYQIHSRTRQS